MSQDQRLLVIAIVIAFATWFFTEGRRGVLGRLLAIAIVVSIVVALGIPDTSVVGKRCRCRSIG